MSKVSVREILKELLDDGETSVQKGPDPDIEHKGKKITLPADPSRMPVREAIDVLYRKAEDEEIEMDVQEIIHAFPMDAAVAFTEALKDLYGWASVRGRSVETIFGSFSIKPDLLVVKTGPRHDDFVQVPMGQFLLPGMENAISCQAIRTPKGPALCIQGTVRKKERHLITELVNATREKLKTSSIYKGKAIQLEVAANGNLDVMRPPEFFDVSNVRPGELILNGDEEGQMVHALWAPIRHTDACLRHNIPLKRGVLLEGTYGTGKTMAAHVTARVCVENGWTFILLDDIRALSDALEFAKRYQPAVVFAEDVDRVMSNRDQRGNDLLNTIDGLLSKDSQIITVLTTNHVERLEKAMLRPGRLDAVISISPPDAESVQRLLRQYGRGLIREDEDLSQVGEVLAGHIPATVREVVERSKLGMIHRGDSQVTEPDLLYAAYGMKRHLDLLQPKQPEPSAADTLAKSLGEVVGSGLNGHIKEAVDESLVDIREHMGL